MRLSDLIARLDAPTSVILDATAGQRPLRRYVGGERGVPVVDLGDPGDEWVGVGADDDVLVLAAVEGEDVASVVKAVMTRAADHAGTVTLAVVLPSSVDDLPLPALLEVRDMHDLEVLTVTDLDYAVLRTAVVLATGREGNEARLVSQLRLERFTAGALEQLARERYRLVEEVELLETLVAGLEERAASLERRSASESARADRAAAARSSAEREAERALQRVRELEGSTSYRLGHFIVRAVKEPRLLLTVPRKLLARIRR